MSGFQDVTFSVSTETACTTAFLGSILLTLKQFCGIQWPSFRSEANLLTSSEESKSRSSSHDGSAHKRPPSPRRFEVTKGLLEGHTPLVKTLSRGKGGHQAPLVVGVAGGTGSGKTTLAQAILDAIEKDHVNKSLNYEDSEEGHHDTGVTYISHDSYYRDLSHLPVEEREKSNFDHPDSLDTALLVDHIRSLKEGKTVHVPKYDYTTHARIVGDVTQADPCPVILVEGILILSDPDLVSLLDIKIFVDTEDDVRLIRRIQRDTVDRGRDVAGIITQYLKTVRPMHIAYVEPSKLHADIIIPMGVNEVALDLVVSRLRHSFM